MHIHIRKFATKLEFVYYLLENYSFNPKADKGNFLGLVAKLFAILVFGI